MIIIIRQGSMGGGTFVVSQGSDVSRTRKRLSSLARWVLSSGAKGGAGDRDESGLELGSPQIILYVILAGRSGCGSISWIQFSSVGLGARLVV
jgi:hypothetical protein